MIRILQRKQSHKGKKYGVIRRNAPNCGLFSFYIVIVGGINKCIEEGLIPVIDMQTYKNPYLDDAKVGKENAWELYFRQPMDIGLKDVDMSQAVIIDAERDIPEGHRPNTSMDFLTNPYAVQYWYNICKKYVRFKPEVESVLIKKKEILDNVMEKKLGVLCRGTDYINLKPGGHPVQPDTDIVIEKAKHLMKIKGCKCIFLATEDADILERFRKEFGDYVLTNQSTRFSNTEGKYLAEIMEEKSVGKYESGLNYLTTIYLLSQCDCLLSGRVSGLLGALLMRGFYEYQYFWNYGFYGEKYTTYVGSGEK